MISIDVTSKKYDCHIDLHQKLTVIVGDSGKGKTVFFKAVIDSSGAYKVNLSDNRYSIIALSEGFGWENTLNDCISNNKKCVFVIDDEDFVITDKFSSYFKSVKGCYFIIINRFNNITFKSLNQLSFSVKEVYNFIANGKEHFLERKYVENEHFPDNIDYFVTEDSSAGKEFLEKCLNTSISSTFGKNKVVDFLKSNLNLYKNKYIFLFIDISAFGSYYELFRTFTKSNNINVYISSIYESFEYMILRSNFYRYDFTNSDEILLFNSFEKYCEYKLNAISKNKPYNQNHDSGKLNSCYVNNCCDKKQSERCICDKGIKSSINKLEYLFKDTEFEFLLSWRK